MRIAILDKDRVQTELICQILHATHQCRHFDSGKALLDHVSHDGCELIVLGEPVTDMSGLEVMQTLHDALPVLLMVERTDEDAIAAALAAGASDYIIKPIRRGELLTRVRILLKRNYPEQSVVEPIRFGPYLFDTRFALLTMAGKPLKVTQKEFELALLFFRNLGRPLSRAYILEAIWPRNAEVPSRTMDTHVSRVRSKLGLRPENGFRLTPVYSYGYQLEQLP